MATVGMSPKTEAAVQAAVGLARVTAEGGRRHTGVSRQRRGARDGGCRVRGADLRGGAVREAAESAAEEREKEIGGPNPVMNALRHAAVCLLEDCTAQCEREATLVRDLGGLQVIGTALHDSRRVDNQLRGRAGSAGRPRAPPSSASRWRTSSWRCTARRWASSSVWDWSGMDDDTPLFSDVVDKQLAGIQASIEDFHATHRTSTYETDRIIDGQRDAIYNVRKQSLGGRPAAAQGQATTVHRVDRRRRVRQGQG